MSVAIPGADTKHFPVTADSLGEAQVTIPGNLTETAGMYRISVKGSAQTSAQTTFAVFPDSVDSDESSIEIDANVISAGGKEAATARVILRDKFGNALPGRIALLLASSGNQEVRAITNQTDEQGAQEFSVRSSAAGSFTLTAIDLITSTVLTQRLPISTRGNTSMGGPLSADLLADVTSDSQGAGSVPASFGITIEPQSPRVGQRVDLTIRALDGSRDVLRNYVGKVWISSESEVDLPGLPQDIPSDLAGKSVGVITFSKGRQGVYSFPDAIRFRKSGTVVLTIEDRTDPSRIIRSESKPITVTRTEGGGDSPMIIITEPADKSGVSGQQIVLRGTGPADANLIVTGGKEPRILASTNSDGTFAITVAVDPLLSSVTLTVSDEQNIAEPAVVHLTQDSAKPVIETVTFTPVTPREGENTLISVTSEPKLKDVRVTLANRDEVLAESKVAPGTYQGYFKAPPASTYQATVAATDPAGNVAETRIALTVNPMGLAKVQNVRATPVARGVELAWDAVEGKVTSYRVYIGQKEGDFPTSLDTKQPTTSAIVRGLEPGVPYVFAVTAVQGNVESEEKSDIVTAMPLGLALRVTARQSALTLDWVFPQETPLRSFLLEYGVERGKYNEQKIFPGETRHAVLEDLLPSLTYYMRLTPITVEGVQLKDLTVQGQGTPLSGLRIAQGGGLPVISEKQEPLHGGAPLRSPEVGLPPMSWLLIALGSLGFFGILWRTLKRRRETFAFLSTMEQRYH